MVYGWYCDNSVGPITGPWRLSETGV